MCCSFVYGSPISKEYGVPNKPFDIYGLPEGSDILSPRTSIPEEIEAPIEGEDILPVFFNPKLEKTEGDVIVPPKSQVQFRDDKNQYSVGFQDSEGTEVKEQGRLISTDNGWEYVIAKTGSYKYLSPEGVEVEVEWVADEKGFRILSSTV